MRTIISLALLLGCGPSSPIIVVAPPAASVAPTSRTATSINIVVTASMNKRGTNEGVTLASGQDVIQSDEVALNVELYQDAYVYVLYVDANKNISQLYSSTGKALMPRGRHRLPTETETETEPETETWWQLDAAKGAASFIVLASPRPLADSDLKARAKASKPRRPPIAEPSRRPDKVEPQTIGGKTRHLPEPSKGPENVETQTIDGETRHPNEPGVFASPDAGGVTTAVLTINRG